MEPLISAWFLGLILGARHALEPDHLAAVATLVSTERRASLLGVLWGAGHTATLLATGGVLVACHARLPAALAGGFEAAVAAMLLYLGARSIWWAARHRQVTDPVHHRALPRRPFYVGMAHGLAGSGALTALALASMPSAGSAFVYLLLFGLGSVAAMAVASGLLGWPLARASHNRKTGALVASLAGALSIVIGLSWAWRSLL
jgi:hypothetical protein